MSHVALLQKNEHDILIEYSRRTEHKPVWIRLPKPWQAVQVKVRADLREDLKVFYEVQFRADHPRVSTNVLLEKCDYEVQLMNEGRVLHQVLNPDTDYYDAVASDNLEQLIEAELSGYTVVRLRIISRDKSSQPVKNARGR